VRASIGPWLAARRDPRSASIMGRPMFEYAALVDAPVQRFTGIVTGPDPDEEIVLPIAAAAAATTPAIAAPGVLSAEATPNEPAASLESLAAAEPVDSVEPVDAAEPVGSAERVVAPEPAHDVQRPPPTEPLRAIQPPAFERRPFERAPVERRPAFAPSSVPSASPNVLPALVGVAVAGITAMWWLRRESHDRGR
jgi:hypothetical protein